MAMLSPCTMHRALRRQSLAVPAFVCRHVQTSALNCTALDAAVHAGGAAYAIVASWAFARGEMQRRDRAAIEAGL